MMERLTFTKEQRDMLGVGYAKYINPSSMPAWDKKLAAYEDSGLTPAEVMELAKAKAEGRLVELPVKIGECLYGIIKPVGRSLEIYESKVQGFRITKYGLKVTSSRCYELYVDDINNSSLLFFSREEAEAILKGESNEKI